LEWRKSSYSGDTGDCVEVAVAVTDDDMFALRDTKDRNGPMLVFPAAEREAFIRDVVAGEFGTYV
jgi:Domain of unknown function (DUF397)